MLKSCFIFIVFFVFSVHMFQVISCLRRRAHLSCSCRATWRSTWPLYARTLWRSRASSRWSPEAQEDLGHRGTLSTWSALTSPPRTRSRCLNHPQHPPVFTQEEEEEKEETQGTAPWRTATRTSATCTRPLTPTHTRPHPTPAAGTCTRTRRQGDTWPRPPAPCPTTRPRPTARCPNRQWTAPRCSPSCRTTGASTSRAARGMSRRRSRRGNPSRTRWTPSGCLRLSLLSTPSGTLRWARPQRPPTVRWPPLSPATRASLSDRS